MFNVTREITIRSQEDSADDWARSFEILMNLIRKTTVVSLGIPPLVATIDAIQYQTASANQSRITRALMGIPYTWNDTDVDAPSDTVVSKLSDFIGAVIADIHINTKGQIVFTLDLGGEKVKMCSYAIYNGEEDFMDLGNVQYRND
jgi:hypothetical protein